MFRSAITALLTLVLLVCPLGCFLRQTAAGSHAQPAPACCSHCRHESPAAPVPAQDDGRGRCCLCEGALHDGPSRSVEVDQHADDLAQRVALSPEGPFTAVQSLKTAEHLFYPPCEPAGRALRTQLSSLLL